MSRGKQLRRNFKPPKVIDYFEKEMDYSVKCTTREEELEYLNQKSRVSGEIYLPTPEEIEAEKKAIREENLKLFDDGEAYGLAPSYTPKIHRLSLPGKRQ